MRRAVLPLLVLLAALGPAAGARADGDPASDVLLSQDVFLPYAPNTVSPPVADALKQTVARAKGKGFGVKVALVADPRDLGSVGQLFGDPQKYADLLTQELKLTVGHGRGLPSPRVLVVLPGGLGGNTLGDDAAGALDGLLPPDGGGGDGLARTAITAVGKLAAADGKPFALPAVPEGSSSSGGGGGVPSFVLFGAPVLLLVLALVAVNLRGGDQGAATAPGLGAGAAGAEAAAPPEVRETSA